MDQPAELALLYDVAVPVDPERSIHIADDELLSDRIPETATPMMKSPL